MSMSGGSSSTGTLSEINVTPLVDVMLVLLVVFMITAPMMQTGVEVNLPNAEAQFIKDDEGKLIVQMRKDGQIYIGKLQVPEAQVKDVLSKNEKLRIDKEAFLHADESLPYGKVVKVMALMQLGGVEKLGFVIDFLE